ncbi:MULTISPECIES: hypothetical protein [unclassified Streptomyces]|nr:MULTISPECIES: hypothetical protein [unclassified Streptomyces]MCX5048877.1 hypothetical protein [Streptomyces sp. NBC_00474]
MTDPPGAAGWATCTHMEGSDVAETISRMQAVLDHFRMKVLDQAA